MINQKLKIDILAIMPTKAEFAKRSQEIALELNQSPSTVKQQIKYIRLSWVPILWNSRWLYIDYTPNAIIKQSNMIDNMKEGYELWMTRIQDAYSTVIKQQWKQSTL